MEKYYFWYHPGVGYFYKTEEDTRITLRISEDIKDTRIALIKMGMQMVKEHICR